MVCADELLNGSVNPDLNPGVTINKADAAAIKARAKATSFKSPNSKTGGGAKVGGAYRSARSTNYKS